MKIAVIGYGSQGQAQAMNLRDTGLMPIIGLPPKSKSRSLASKERFEIYTPQKAIERCDSAVILAPDHKHRDLFESIPPRLLAGKSLIFAHGLSIAFGLIKPPSTCDLILVAPHGPGVRIRELYKEGKPFTAFWGVEHNATGKANEIAIEYAAAIGCPRQGLFKTSFRDEAIGDIFGEQVVLCGGLTGLLETGFETLVKSGLSPENAYLECVYQLDLIIDLIKSHGPAGMFERISKTAAIGSLDAKDKLFDKSMRQKMKKLFGEIESGRFARSLMRESETGMKQYKRNLAKLKKSKLQKAQEKMGKRMAGRA
jgi:ketol-acid reductoisomerase